jgi:deoxycytidylate deaminase
MMTLQSKRISHPELFFGFVAPIGADINSCVNEFREYLKAADYNIIELKVTDIFPLLAELIEPDKPLVQKPIAERYSTHIAYGNQIRRHFNDDAALAAMTIARLIRERIRKTKGSFEKNAYLIHQFKRPDEIKLFRALYGRLFFQISIYSRRGARVDFLSRKFASDASSANAKQFRSEAENIINRDEHESDEPHGQRVSKIFHDAEFIINTDINEPSIAQQVHRFCDLLFGANGISPTKIEYGMFIAKAAALRTLDLSRQVGAAIFSNTMEIISMGSNEVPKAGGGTYWADDVIDDREYRRGIDSNDKRKREILGDLLKRLGSAEDVDDVIKKKDVKDSQLMDSLEYGRIVHAEMLAISDAARSGRSVNQASLFCTTFPCHMCAKHIVAAGIKDVIFLEPYPKSLASDLHSDSILIEGADRGAYDNFPFVSFSHFYGVSPRRYREFFERDKRKDDYGNFQKWRDVQPQPIVDIKVPFSTLRRMFCASRSKVILSDQRNNVKRCRASLTISS